MSKLPLYPKHPERVCWGCDKYCSASDLACGNGSERTQHPIELFGEDWVEWAEARNGRQLSERDVATSDADLRSRALDALSDVIDPELGIDIVELGLVHEIGVNGSALHVQLMVTTPACPLGEYIAADAKQRLVALAGVTEADVRLIWDPPWSPARMTVAARQALGWTA